MNAGSGPADKHGGGGRRCSLVPPRSGRNPIYAKTCELRAGPAKLVGCKGPWPLPAGGSIDPLKTPSARRGFRGLFLGVFCFGEAHHHEGAFEEDHQGDGEHELREDVWRGDQRGQGDDADDDVTASGHQLGTRKDAGAVEQHEEDGEEEAAAEGEDELHDEVEVFLHAGQRFQLQATVHALKADEPAEGGGHDHEVRQTGAQGEQHGGGDQEGEEGLFLARVEAGGDEGPELVGDDRETDEAGGEQRDFHFDEEGAVELGEDQLAGALGKGAGERPDQHRKDAIGEIKAHAERHDQRIDHPQQPRPQFQQVIEQRRLGLVDIADHARVSAWFSVWGAGAGSAYVGAWAAIAGSIGGA